jgi:hypothetical protein
MMKLFDILKLELPSLKPEDCKIHLAVVNNAGEDPLDVFLAGDFPEWQRWQKHRNFERPYIVSLVKMGEHGRWLFAGVHSTHGSSFKKIYQCYYYRTKNVPELDGLTGRLIIAFPRPGRQCRLIAERWAAQLQVSELKPCRLVIEEFSGFTKVLLLKSKLDIIVAQEIESWKSALSSVAGVYLITDTKTGRHYIGSAYGVGGIWERWRTYSESGHGNNKNLKSILKKTGLAHSHNFQFSILETADTNASKDDVLKRERHWKNALCSHERHGGYNAN